MDQFKKVVNRPPVIPNLIIQQNEQNNQLINNLQMNNVILSNNRRCSTGLLFEPVTDKFNRNKLNSTQITKLRQFDSLKKIQNLHYESLSLGLNGLNSDPNQNAYNQNLKLGLLLRSSLPATPISTPIRSEFKPFDEQLLLDRLSQTPPMQRKQWNFSNVKVHDSCIKNNSSGNTSLDRHFEKQISYANKMKQEFNLDNLNENDININRAMFQNFNINKNDLNNNRNN